MKAGLIFQDPFIYTYGYSLSRLGSFARHVHIFHLPRRLGAQRLLKVDRASSRALLIHRLRSGVSLWMFFLVGHLSICAMSAGYANSSQ